MYFCGTEAYGVEINILRIDFFIRDLNDLSVLIARILEPRVTQGRSTIS